jgi:hypothetical protein
MLKIDPVSESIPLDIGRNGLTLLFIQLVVLDGVII